nr:MAG TPA: hypothetical protein [Bacteriophage sp.]
MFFLVYLPHAFPLKNVLFILIFGTFRFADYTGSISHRQRSV